MAEDIGGEPLDATEAEEGGPVKSFLEHLEDLRWVLIKSIAAAGVAMLACFFGGNYVFKVIKWPLLRSPLGKSGPTQVVRIMLGTNQLQIFHIRGTNDVLASFAGTNRFVTLQLVPVPVSTNETTAAEAVLGITVKVEP